jgi:hypothetical protein
VRQRQDGRSGSEPSAVNALRKVVELVGESTQSRASRFGLGLIGKPPQKCSVVMIPQGAFFWRMKHGGGPCLLRATSRWVGHVPRSRFGCHSGFSCIKGGYALPRSDDPRRDSCDLSPLLRHCAVAVFVRYLGTTQQHLRGIAAIERNRLPSEVLKRLFTPLHLASLARVLRPVRSRATFTPIDGNAGPYQHHRTCGPSAGHRWQSRSVVEAARVRGAVTGRYDCQ